MGTGSKCIGRSKMNNQGKKNNNTLISSNPRWGLRLVSKHLGEKTSLFLRGKCVPCTCMRSKRKELDNPKSFIAFCFLLLTAALLISISYQERF